MALAADLLAKAASARQVRKVGLPWGPALKVILGRVTITAEQSAYLGQVLMEALDRELVERLERE